ncbi:succinoglycan biosynthesis protein ExoM [Paraferrimonas haliotis]|uniref:Succinoglycan biosynthesis protein ExoM n=2 Tax=Paraferrimonas haliotis TaxID=2013866 RepID=A0AA37U0Z5_9GAMM|nr:succinoglycan biosynthesis protein ExoM [Paraferrimonas haliotis]
MSLAALKVPNSFRLECVVVDNCKQQSGRVFVERAGEQLTIPVRYYVEPRKNICLARNLCVAHAKGQWITFIDDDELVAEDWLTQLMDAAIEFKASVVMGSVIASYPENTPKWIVDGDYFNRTLSPRGTEINVGATNNVLIYKDHLPQRQGPFDSDYGITGGGDTELFNTMHNQGRRIVTCPQAKVFETVEKKRLNADYLLKRSIRIGEVYARVFFKDKWRVNSLIGFIRAIFLTIVASALHAFARVTHAKGSFRYQLMQRANYGKVRYFLNVERIEIYGKHKEGQN